MDAPEPPRRPPPSVGAHTPALHVPVFHGPNGLPMGVQLIGECRRDAELLAHAAWVERALRS